ncbi:pyruvate-flavodoxin oxidoreductase [Cutibacterium acnes JCM 18920]|nr:pyruvate-flavodoxin oxidoreductase [Cutibacterium acnes JCM 18920]
MWDKLPDTMQRQVLDKHLDLWTIDALSVARKVGLRNRTNTILQTCFFAISGVLPKDEAIAKIKDSIQKTYGKKSQKIVEMNHAAVDASLEHLHQVKVPDQMTANHSLIPAVREDSPEFVKNVTARMIEGFGDLLPVSALPDDGTYCRHHKVRAADAIGRHRHLGAQRLHPVRQLRLRLPARRHSLQVLPGSLSSRVPRNPSSPQNSMPPVCRSPATPCRSSPTSAPAADCASRPARPTQSGNPTARPSTLKSTSTRPSSART